MLRINSYSHVVKYRTCTVRYSNIQELTKLINSKED